MNSIYLKKTVGKLHGTFTVINRHINSDHDFKHRNLACPIIKYLLDAVFLLSVVQPEINK